MKKLVSVLLIGLIAITLISKTSAAEITSQSSVEVLSDMSEEECFEFIKSQGVKIPYDENNVSKWGTIAKEMIEQLETDPEHVFFSITLR